MRHRFTACAVMLVACATANAGLRPDNHAPITVMGDHIHEKGELMFSYRYMHMSMKDNRDSTSRMSPEEIVTTVPNRFANPPMMPPTLRVVPTKMTMDMHMLGIMYAPTDRLTLMGMANYQKKGHDTHYVRRAHGHRAFGQIQDQHKRYRRHLGRRPLRPVSR